MVVMGIAGKTIPAASCFLLFTGWLGCQWCSYCSYSLSLNMVFSLTISRLILICGCVKVYNIFSDTINMWGSDSSSFTKFWLLINTNVNFIISTFYDVVFNIRSCAFIFWTYKVSWWIISVMVFLVFLLNH